MVANLNFAIKAVNEAHAALDEVSGQLSSVEGKAGSSGGALSDMGGKLAAVGAMAVAAGVGIGAMIADKSISAAADLGAAVNSLSIATGLSNTSASEWIGVGEHFGVTSDYITKSMDKASKAIFGGIDPTTGMMVAGGKLDTVLQSYGITTKDASGKAEDMNTIMMSVSDTFKNMPDGPEKTALALKLFGKAGVDMIPMLDAGSTGVQKIMGDVKGMGLVLDESGVAKTKAFAFAQRDMNESIKGVEVEIGMALIPILTSLITFVTTQAIPAIHDAATTYLPKLESAFGTVASAVGPVVAAVLPFIQTLVGNKDILLGVGVVIGTVLVAAFVAMAIAAGTAAVAVLAAVAPFVALGVAAAAIVIGVKTAGEALGLFGGDNSNAKLAAAATDKVTAALKASASPTTDFISGMKSANDTLKANPAFSDQVTAAMGGMVTGALKSGLSFKQVMDDMKQAGVDNVPQVTKVLGDAMNASDDLKGSTTALRHGADGDYPAFKDMAVTNLDAVAAATQADATAAAAAVTDWFTSNDKNVKGISGGFDSLASTVDTDVTKWLASLDRVTSDQNHYVENIQVQLDAAKALYPANFDAISKIILAENPTQAGQLGDLARAGTGAYGTALGDMVGQTQFNIDAAHNTIAANNPGMLQAGTDLGQNVVDGIIIGLNNDFALRRQIKNMAALIPDSVKGVLNASSPSKVMEAIGKDAVQGLVDGVTLFTPAILSAMTELGQGMDSNLAFAIKSGSATQIMAAMQELGQGIDSNLADALSTLPNTVWEFSRPVIAAMTELGQGMDSNLADAIRTGIPSQIKSAMDELGQGMDSNLAFALKQTNPELYQALEDYWANLLPHLTGPIYASIPTVVTAVTTVATATIGGYAISTHGAWEALVKGHGDIANLILDNILGIPTPVVAPAVAAVSTVATATIGGYVVSTHGAWQAAQAGRQDIASLIIDNVMGIAPAIAAIFPKLSSSAQQAVQIIADGLISGQLTVAAASKLLAQILPSYLSDPVMYERVKQAGSDIIAAYNSGMASVPVNPILPPVVTPTGASLSTQAPTSPSGSPPPPQPGAVSKLGSQARGIGGNVQYENALAIALGTDINTINWTPIADIVVALNAKFKTAAEAPSLNVGALLPLLRTHGLSFDQGGWLQPGVTLAVNNTGRPERVGGGEITVNVYYSAPNALVVDGAAVTQAVKTVLPEIKRQLTMQGSWGMA